MTDQFPNIKKWLPGLDIQQYDFDFNFDYGTKKSTLWQINAADLERILSEASKVYSWGNKSTWHAGEIPTTGFYQSIDKPVTALLIGVRELEKPKCEHAGIIIKPDVGFQCAHCNKPLKPAGWEIAE